MAERRTGPGRRPRKPSALEVLGPVELAGVFEDLLRRHPELRAEANRIARELLTDTDQEAVADEVEADLRSLSIEALNGRAGRQRWGYVNPTEAAWELLGEAVEVYDGEVARLLALHMVEAAAATALGLVAGLYRCRGCDDGDLLLSWAPDFPWEHARGVLGVLGQAEVELPQESVGGAAPEWADSLLARRTVG
ncbi:MAG: hypothetical protein ACYDD0_08615 [Candidatus Dormibacteria bacterium]